MEAVIKVGGSLAEHPRGLRNLCRELSELVKSHTFLIVPGGGRFADVVRMLDQRFGLSDTAAHKMAVLGMDIYGLFLSDLTPNSCTCYILDEAERLSATGTLPILLPSRLIFLEDPLKHSWDVTSDSIAAWIASLLHVKKLILVTDVDGVFTDDPKRSLNAEFIEEIEAGELLGWKKRTSVDKMLPEILLRERLNCLVVNGRYPERVKAVLEGEATVCTRITV